MHAKFYFRTMTTTLAVPTEAHLPVANEPADFETWKQDGEALFSKYEAAESTFELIQWKIGDWLVRGEKQFRENAYEEAERITGWTRETLYNVKWVTTNIPPENSLRSEIGLKWSHFKELARLKDDKAREKVLEDVRLHFAGSSFTATVEDIRDRVDLALRKPSSKTDKNFVSMQVFVKPKLRNLLKDYARAEKKTPDALLRWIVEKHVADHKPQIESKIESWKSRQAKAKEPVKVP